MKLLLSISFLLIVINSFSQPIEKQLNDYFNSIRNESVNPVMLDKIVDGQKNKNEILPLVVPFTVDSVNEVRYSAYSLISTIGQQSTSTPFRQKAAAALVTGWRDKDSGINGMVGSSLQKFKQSDFAYAVKDTLRNLIKAIPPYYDKLVMLCGYLDMKDQITVIQSQLRNGQIKNKKEQWASYLALSRLGDKQTIDYVMKRVRKLGINDDVVYEIFPDLIYTRQPEAIAYIVSAFQSDEYKCESANPEATATIPCAYRLMEYLAPVIQDFPLKTDASGDIIVSDYSKALTQARQWFVINSKYVIDSQDF